MTKEEYFLQKSKFYYDMFLQNKYVKKVSIILKYKDKFLVLVKNGSHATLPGGSVEPLETTRNAAIRETFEETNLKINELKYLTKVYYNVKWTYNNTEFNNKRIEFYYLSIINDINSIMIKGVDGEFDNSIKLQLCSFNELEKLNLNKTELEIIKCFC